MHKTASTPLAILYAGLVVYASLYPFAEWRNQGIAPWAFLMAPPPKYWTAFDVAVNVVGYVPLGAFVALSALRSGRGQRALWLPVLLAACLSLSMESIQSYLPSRVASREDWLLNAAGAAIGALGAVALEHIGVIDRWGHFRQRWFVPQARGGLVLLVSWPLALLFPAAVPFGMGQVFERAEGAAAEVLAESPFLEWLPVREIELQPLLPGAMFVCVYLGLLIPSFVTFCVVRVRWRRFVMMQLVWAAGLFASALSAALSWGPQHAFSWLEHSTRWAGGLAWITALALIAMSWRVQAALLLLSLGIFLSLLNQAPESPYFALTLQAWEQGRFIRFNGLAQWIGWLWPYAAVVYAIALISRRESQN